MKLSKHAKARQEKRNISTFRIFRAFHGDETVMRCPHTQRYIVSYKDTTLVLCPKKENVITTYKNDSPQKTKLKDVLDFSEYKKRLRPNSETKKETVQEVEVQLEYEEYINLNRKKAS